jgi:tetratricopeptide (TPR) repeat protein
MEEPTAMQKKPWAIYVWPGLPHVWTRGSWSALGVAVIAAALLSAMIVCSFGWSELINTGLRNTLWVSLAIMWGVSAIVSAVKLRRQVASGEIRSSEDLFNQAVEVYLKGDYYQVERLLNELLDKNARDLEARLLLATLLRHTGRFDEAWKQLDQLLCFDGAEKWELEIQAERERLTEAGKNLKDKLENGMAIATNVNSSEISHAA